MRTLMKVLPASECKERTYSSLQSEYNPIIQYGMQNVKPWQLLDHFKKHVMLLKVRSAVSLQTTLHGDLRDHHVMLEHSVLCGPDKLRCARHVH